MEENEHAGKIEKEVKTHIVYPINSKPKLGLAIPLGLQHVLTLFGATTLVPLILGPAIFGKGSPEIGHFVSNIYLVMGLATIFQIFIGSKLPIVQGSSFAFIAPLFSIVALVKSTGGDSSMIMRTIAGALIAGGALEAIIGYSGLIGKLRKVITPVTMGPTIMLIGFSLFPVAVQMNAAKYWPVSLIVVAGIFYFSLVAKGKVRVFPVLLTLIVVYLISLFLTQAGIFGIGHPARVNLGQVASSKWITLPIPFPYGSPVFNVAAIFAVLAAFLASMIESIGDYHSVCYAAGEKDPDAKTISRGIGSEGLGCIVGGIFGGSGATSYTENIGLINITGVASRFVIFMGALILIALSFIAKLGAVIATIPSPIIGGAYIALFGVIGALGIQVLTRCDLGSQRNLMIVGFTFLIGIGVGFWMGGYAGGPGFYAANQYIWGTSGAGKVFWDITGALLSTPMAVGAMSGILLDNIIPGTDAERGIVQAADAMPSD